jgi:bilirubin oxidase
MKIGSGLFFLIFLPVLGVAQNPLFIPDTLTGNTIQLNIQEGQQQFFSGTTTQTYGINGDFLAPTLILNKGQQVSMNVTNMLSDSTTIHWHGMHVAPENDGGPHTPILPNSNWNPQFEVMDWASTYWYHPHLHHKTNEHVQKGIAGMIIVRDAIEAAIVLPRTYGVDDIPVIIQSKGFDSNNQIIVETALDNTIMINGTINPVSSLPAQIVRLRLLNGSSERIYNIGLSNGADFTLIGTDGGLLEAAISLSRLKLAPGERAEILLNLGGLNGQTLFLKSFGSELPNGLYGAAQPGMGAGQTIPNYTLNLLNGNDFNLLQINVLATTANPVLTLPTNLVSHNPWLEQNADQTRTVTFSPANMGPTAINGPFVFDMMPFDMMMINHIIQLNDIEVWTLQNNTPIAHPFHIHDVPFYILDINGIAPPPELAGRKDVVLVPGGMGTVRFISKFEDFSNEMVPYMYHCHMLTHEDGGMMGQFIVENPNSSIEDHIVEGFQMYPNPASDHLVIQANESIATIEITDHLGKTVASMAATKDGRIPINNLNKGAYWVTVTFENQRRVIKNLIVD